MVIPAWKGPPCSTLPVWQFAATYQTLSRVQQRPQYLQPHLRPLLPDVLLLMQHWLSHPYPPSRLQFHISAKYPLALDLKTWISKPETHHRPRNTTQQQNHTPHTLTGALPKVQRCLALIISAPVTAS